MNNPIKAYLGDGVYASNDGFHIILSTVDNIIYLDEYCLINLETYLKKLKEMNNES